MDDTDTPIFVGLHFTISESNFTYVKLMTEAEARKAAKGHPDTVYFFCDQLNEL